MFDFLSSGWWCNVSCLFCTANRFAFFLARTQVTTFAGAAQKKANDAPFDFKVKSNGLQSNPVEKWPAVSLLHGFHAAFCICHPANVHGF